MLLTVMAAAMKIIKPIAKANATNGQSNVARRHHTISLRHSHDGTDGPRVESQQRPRTTTAVSIPTTKYTMTNHTIVDTGQVSDASNRYSGQSRSRNSQSKEAQLVLDHVFHGPELPEPLSSGLNVSVHSSMSRNLVFFGRGKHPIGCRRAIVDDLH